jgi:hypothetical protein
VTRDETIELLCNLLTPGSTVYTIRRSTARSGLSCTLDLYTVAANIPLKLTQYIADILNMPQDHTTNAIKVRGWGQDAGASVVMALSYALHGTMGKGLGMEPNGACAVTDSDNYRAGHSLEWKEL